MDYLARESAPFGAELWSAIDKAVVETARRYLVGRRFLQIFGPLGAGVQSVPMDTAARNEEVGDGIVRTTGRTFRELPQLFADFQLLWRDLENSGACGYPLDVSAVYSAAQALALQEDRLVFFGSDFIDAPGLFTAGGRTLPLTDWNSGESAVTSFATAIAMIQEEGLMGRYAACVSPDLYGALQRLQPGTGLTEVERVSRLLGGRLYMSSVLGKQKAVLVCAEPQYMDLAVGQDMATAYLELKDLNHSFRIIETVLPRIKDKRAIVVLER